MRLNSAALFSICAGHFLTAPPCEMCSCSLSWLKSTTQTPTQMTPRLKRSLLSWRKPTRCRHSLSTAGESSRPVPPSLDLWGLFCAQVLGDEVKRKQYDTYGTAGFGQSHARQGQQQYYRAGQASVDPEELFRKIFGEFTGAAGFGDIHRMFDQRPEVRTAATHCASSCRTVK